MRRFHVENEEHSCRVGCHDEPDCLSDYNKCFLLSNIFVSLRRNAEIHPRENHILYDLITEVLHANLQSGIVVMGFIDAFVYAHNYHRHNADRPGKFEDCMEVRIRLMTAITPAYAHAYQASFLGRRPLDIPLSKVLPTVCQGQVPEPSQHPYHYSEKKVTTTKDGPCSPMEGLTSLMGSLQQAPAHPMEDFSSCFGPVITSELTLL